MKFTYGLPAALIGAAIVVVQPQFVAALTTPEIARAITVRIDGPNTGSGVIVERKGNTYTVLTNWHVVETVGTYTVQTQDGQRYSVNPSVVKRLPGVDLAMLQFTSSTSYSVAELGDSDQLSEGTTVYVAGWADPDGISSERRYRFPDGRISERVQKPKEGYALVYSNPVKPGMSGGPVLNEQGRVVGINGLAVPDARTGAVDYLGIPINTFVRLRTAVSPPPAPGQPTTSSPSPSLNPGNAQGARAALRDVQGYWAQPYIEALAAKDIIAGFPDGTFKPYEPVTRAQFAAIINKAFSPMPQREAVDFTDVSRNFWGYQAIQSAYQGGFVAGYPGGVFQPQQQIPRVQVLVSLANGLSLRSDNASALSIYTDASQIPNYATDPVAAATVQQLVVNYPTPSQLNPNREATRAEVAAFVYQALVNAGRAEAIPSPYVVTLP